MVADTHGLEWESGSVQDTDRTPWERVHGSFPADLFRSWMEVLTRPKQFFRSLDPEVSFARPSVHDLSRLKTHRGKFDPRSIEFESRLFFELTDRRLQMIFVPFDEPFRNRPTSEVFVSVVGPPRMSQ